MILTAPAKLNLCLYLGPTREDGLHEIVSAFQPLPLADSLEVTEADRDEVICEGVAAPDLTARALAALREAGWDHPPVRIEVDKRIPVAAGLGGGSADAAAVLRMAGGDLHSIEEIAMGLGADVPSQLRQEACLVSGAGETVEGIGPFDPFGIVIVPQDEGLSSADVYREADSLGLGRSEGEIELIRLRLGECLGGGGSPLDHRGQLVNDLEQAALSLRPELGEVLAALDSAGAEHAALTGSGPTAFGLFSELTPERWRGELAAMLPEEALAMDSAAGWLQAGGSAAGKTGTRQGR